MENKQIYLYGAGGHAKVIVDILQNCKKPVAGIFDDDLSKTVWNLPTLTFPAQFNFISDELIISIGDNLIRKKVSSKIIAKYHTAIHPLSIISTYSSIEEGSVIMGGAVINADTRIGKHAIINTLASIDHDCLLGNFVHISPNATLSGGVTVDECSHVGSGAIIIPGKKIGANVTIGAGAVIISDIPDNAVVVGNPGRIIKMKNDKY